MKDSEAYEAAAELMAHLGDKRLQGLVTALLLRGNNSGLADTKAELERARYWMAQYCKATQQAERGAGRTAGSRAGARDGA